jgi:adenosine kinase
MNVFVSGSLAYDRIMNFPGRFSDHIMPDKIHNLNVSFNVDSLVERPGGTAGNISYCLVLLGEQPHTLATIGYDYSRYFEWMEKNSVPKSGIKVIVEQPTAGAYITTDMGDNQITGFHPGAMLFTSDFDFSSYKPEESIGILAPGNLDDMINYSRIYKEKGIRYIFDPGQSLPIWTGDGLKECIDGADILIANDYEMGLITNTTGLDMAALGKLAKSVITTKGEDGSLITTGGTSITIPVVKPNQVSDPTGAGDSYRGGLIKGLIEGKQLAEAALMGSVCASFAIEVQGTQEYSFTSAEFQQRLSTVKIG